MKNTNYLIAILSLFTSLCFGQVLVNSNNVAAFPGAALAIDSDYLILPRNEAGTIASGDGVLTYDKGNSDVLLNNLLLTKNIVPSTATGAVQVQENGFDTGMFVAPDGDSTETPDLSDAGITDVGGVIIGAQTSTRDQALVIESTNLGVKLANCPTGTNAPVGGMCYDSTADAIKMFNGSNFYYLRASR